MVQRIMNEYVEDKNLYCTRQNDHSMWPTFTGKPMVVSADWCLSLMKLFRP